MMEQDDLWLGSLTSLGNGLSLLPDKPEETTENTLKALWLAAAGRPMSVVRAESAELPLLSSNQVETLQRLIERRLQGEPLAHISGRQQFMELELLASPDALVPRRETELLGYTALQKAIEIAESQPSLTVVDICTGSGNVALALAWHLEQRNIAARIHGADLSEVAIGLARQNSASLKLRSPVDFRAGDLTAPFQEPDFIGKVDLLTCNPPYITQTKVSQMAPEIAEHEPQLAFDGGPFGVSILMRLLEEGPKLLKSAGWLVFEVGMGQGPAMVKRMERMQTFGNIHAVADNTGTARVIMAQC